MGPPPGVRRADRHRSAARAGGEGGPAGMGGVVTEDGTGGGAKIAGRDVCAKPGPARCSKRRAISTPTSFRRKNGTTPGSWGSRPKTIPRSPGRCSCRTAGTAERRPRPSPAWFSSASSRSRTRVREGSRLPAWRYLNNFDWILFLAILAVCSVGLVVIYSATTGTPSAGAFHKQMIWLGLGLVLMLLALLIDYHTLAEFSYVFDGIGLLLLLLALVYGRGGN